MESNDDWMRAQESYMPQLAQTRPTWQCMPSALEDMRVEHRCHEGLQNVTRDERNHTILDRVGHAVEDEAHRPAHKRKARRHRCVCHDIGNGNTRCGPRGRQSIDISSRYPPNDVALRRLCCLWGAKLEGKAVGEAVNERKHCHGQRPLHWADTQACELDAQSLAGDRHRREGQLKGTAAAKGDQQVNAEHCQGVTGGQRHHH
mmetsp:Transcript_139196/g.433119  ORF Transcript_139196/g.433119 Transcript_139196/m.433119 type:complete len:203 (-) Transcript_139196:258-866(-)